ncbi:TRAP transporter small permease [Sneathiella chinensis]|uniref:TRAP transporter small permease protein n=1 Tax=Sneathiella chinensis TaxID=349750 RepID=A0ABQ5U3X1_9PROT|nr:TRAP transporter small permease [Sneathiella chinensis]GLQ05890.1 transporter [Sneathiella chinensis]
MLINLIEGAGRLAAVLAGVILVAMVGFVLYEIVLRSFFASSTYVLDEFVGYGVAIMTFLSFSMALREGTFIRVNLVIANVPPGLRRMIEVLSCALGTAIFSFLAAYLLKIVVRNFERGVVSNSVAEIPLWVPQSLMLVGVMLLVAQFAALTVQYVQGAPISDSSEEL